MVDCHRVCLLVLAVVAVVGIGFEIRIVVVDSEESLEGNPD